MHIPDLLGCDLHEPHAPEVHIEYACVLQQYSGHAVSSLACPADPPAREGVEMSSPIFPA